MHALTGAARAKHLFLEAGKDFRVMFTCNFVSSDAQVDVLGSDLVKECKDAVTSDNLAIKVVRLERLQLHEAMIVVHRDFLVLSPLFELRILDICGRCLPILSVILV